MGQPGIGHGRLWNAGGVGRPAEGHGCSVRDHGLPLGWRNQVTPGELLTASAPLAEAASAGALVDGLPFARLTDVPRARSPRDDVSLEDPFLAQRVAALLGSYVAEDAVAVAWSRRDGEATIDVSVGGASLLSAPAVSSTRANTNACAVNLPAGASAQRLTAAEFRANLGEFAHWQRIAGVADSIALDDEHGKGHESRPPSLEDTLTSAWPGPFAWFVVAQPLPVSEVRSQAVTLSRLIPTLRAKAGNSQENALELERQESRYQELRRAERRGLWTVHLLAGAHDKESAYRLAAILCGCLLPERLPYTLRPAGDTAALPTVLRAVVDSGAAGTSPFSASTDMLATVVVSPRSEMPGIRHRTRPAFTVTPNAAGELRLGTVLNWTGRDAGAFPVSLETLNLHAFVCGATGAGKSQTIRTLLQQLSGARPETVPWLVIEPAKAEYRRMAGRLAKSHDVIAIRPGAIDVPAVGVNPLEPEPGFPLQTHLDLTRALFLASFQAEEPFPQVLSAALTRCYEELGWDLALSAPRAAGIWPRWPTLGDLQRVANQVVTTIGYGEEVTRNVRGFVDVRLSSLRHGTPGRFFEGGHPIDIGRLLKHNVVLEIEDLGDDRDKAFLIGTIIIRVVEHLRMAVSGSSDAPTLRHVMVIEEAHRLLRRTDASGPVAHAVELFASLLAEVRAYGEGIVIAEQIPSKLVADVIKNTAIKIVHRLPAQDDRDAVGATMNLTDDQSEYVVTVDRGTAAVFTDGMDYPSLVRMDWNEKDESDRDVLVRPPLSGRFSAACGRLCQEHECTLRQMRNAQRALEDDERLVVWTELAVLAHILGFPCPGPSPELRRAIGTMEGRAAECAIAHGVEHAVSLRAGDLARHYTPDELAGHVAGELRSMLDGATDAGDDEDWRWQAGPFRWNQLLSVLTVAERRGERGRHADSAMWEARYGVEIPGATCTAQREVVRSWAVTESKRRSAVLFGVGEPSRLETAVGLTRNQDGWDDGLASVIARAVQLEVPWPQNYLVGDHAWSDNP
jgi:hypothetical protein